MDGRWAETRDIFFKGSSGPQWVELVLVWESPVPVSSAPSFDLEPEGKLQAAKSASLTQLLPTNAKVVEELLLWLQDLMGYPGLLAPASQSSR